MVYTLNPERKQKIEDVLLATTATEHLRFFIIYMAKTKQITEPQKIMPYHPLPDGSVGGHLLAYAVPDGINLLNCL